MVDVLLFGMTRGKDTVRKLRMAYVYCDLHMRWCFSQGVESCFLGVNLSYYYTFSIIIHYIVGRAYTFTMSCLFPTRTYLTSSYRVWGGVSRWPFRPHNI